MSDNKDTAVKVAVRIRPLSDYEEIQDQSLCLNAIPNENQIRAGPNTYFTFDYVFSPENAQAEVYDACVEDLLNAAFEGFNATILAYGQTGSGKTYTMGSSSEQIMTEDSLGIIPRVIRNLFEMIHLREDTEPNCTYKIYVQFLEIYGEDIRDLLDLTRTSKVSIRETSHGEVIVTGAREELVSSFEQMMKALEDGTKSRTTASTKMNQSSSRSHAIFTVNLERILYSDIENTDKTAADILEVRKCKFHFVDLAGSERAKRTGAQGVQLKEGIDINKGLLALGNVISALGDETKKGKVFVPYRDSKLTRMLQDSLGGNSKTLMICCVSPAAVNYSESLNALRYANRARNIKNKPVVNRDPNLVLVDELRSTLKILANELLQVRTSKQYVEIDSRISIPMLEEVVNGTIKLNQFTAETPSKPAAEEKTPLSRTPATRTNSKEISNLKEALKKAELDKAELKFKFTESDVELKRLIDQLKLAKLQYSELSEQMFLIQSERDYFQMKFNESIPETGHPPDASVLEEKQQFMKIITDHKREIERLKEELARANTLSLNQMPLSPDFAINPAEIDAEFTTTVATLIAQTRQQLQEESRKLNAIESFSKGEASTSSLDSDEEVELIQKEKMDEIEEEKKFARRQKILSHEFQELGQSIQLKEQLMQQLIKSQHQYNIMKTYYEQKLAELTTTVEEKQQERDQLSHELHELEALKKNEAAIIKTKERESRLRSELQLKDEELKSLKKKQEDLKNLTQVTTQYSKQLVKLESDITLMKKQRVELSKTLQLEKKNHILQLNEKVKEIEKLKKELLKASNEMKKLERSKEIAEKQVKEVVSMQKEKENNYYAVFTGQQQLKDSMNNISGGVAGASKKKAIPTRPLSMPEIASAATARAAIREINRNSHRFSSKRLLTEDELKTKKWIDQRITEISAREAAAEALKKQYEHQLELLHKKELLEKERTLAILHSETSDDMLETASNKLPSSINNSVNANDLAQLDSRSRSQDYYENPASEDSPSRQLLLSTHEEEKLLEIIEERLATITGQLNARNQKISDIEKQIHDEGDIPGSEKALEVLKRTAAGSLPGAHELIRLLFDMLVHSNKTIQMKTKQVEDLSEKEKNLTQKNDDLQRQLITEKHNFDMELTTINKEYEEKLQTIFQQITTLENSTVNNISSNGISPLVTPDKRLLRPQSNNNIFASPIAIGKVFSSSHRIDKASPLKSFDPLDIQLTIALEENKFLKSKNEREALRYAQLHNKCVELESIKIRLIRDLEEKNQQIRFLEEDRELFKEMVEDLKMGLNKLGKDGKAIISSVKDSASQKKTNGFFGEYLQLSDDEADEDDTASVIGQYQSLVLEINRNGGSLSTSATGTSASSFPTALGSTSLTPTGSIISLPQSRNIYDRLTNPSNYTGHMKNVFENDLELKRKKVQQMKHPPKSSKEPSNKKSHDSNIPSSSSNVVTQAPRVTAGDAPQNALLIRSHSHDEYEPVVVRSKNSTSSHNLISTNQSHSASSQSLEVEATEQGTIGSSSAQKRRSSIGSGKAPSIYPLPTPPSSATVKLNLDHLSLEDDSALVDAGSRDTPSSTNSGPTNVFTRIPVRAPSGTNSRSNSAFRRKSLGGEDLPSTSNGNSHNNNNNNNTNNISTTTTSTPNTSTSNNNNNNNNNRTTSPAWRKTQPNQFQHQVQYYYNRSNH